MLVRGGGVLNPAKIFEVPGNKIESIGLSEWWIEKPLTLQKLYGSKKYDELEMEGKKKKVGEKTAWKKRHKTVLKYLHRIT